MTDRDRVDTRPSVRRPAGPPAAEWEGVLPVWKPSGWTSHDVVVKVRRLLREKRIGHTGTLDPQVTGVLPLCLGRATRLVEYLQELPKTYAVTMVIGYATDTEDDTGTVIERADRVTLTESEIRACILGFTGEIEQVPPMYSAVKIDGKRLYELAREGKTVERKPRKVTVYAIRGLDVQMETPYPIISFEVECSKGTYIRTLCTDIGRKLGVPATMRKLVRTATGPFGPDDCLTLDEIAARAEAGTLRERLIAPDRAVAHLPALVLAGADAAGAACGKAVPLDRARPLPERPARTGEAAAAGIGAKPQASGPTRVPADGASAAAGTLVRLYAEDGCFLGLFRADEPANRLRPEKVFAAPGGAPASRR